VKINALSAGCLKPICLVKHDFLVLLHFSVFEASSRPQRIRTAFSRQSCSMDKCWIISRISNTRIQRKLCAGPTDPAIPSRPLRVPADIDCTVCNAQTQCIGSRSFWYVNVYRAQVEGILQVSSVLAARRGKSWIVRSHPRILHTLLPLPTESLV